jgi:hypothetical protein
MNALAANTKYVDAIASLQEEASRCRAIIRSLETGPDTEALFMKRLASINEAIRVLEQLCE